MLLKQDSFRLVKSIIFVNNNRNQQKICNFLIFKHSYNFDQSVESNDSKINIRFSKSLDKDGNRTLKDQQIIDSKNENLLHIPKLNMCKNKCKVLGCDSHGNTDKNKNQYCPIFQEQLKKGFLKDFFI